jgi:hypothetical protein
VSDEAWRPVRGYQGWYEISDLGNVYALNRAMLLTPQVNSAGYRFVRLHRYGRVRAFTVASLVLAAFCWPPPHTGSRARHGPGGKLDDSLANLTWTR